LLETIQRCSKLTSGYAVVSFPVQELGLRQAAADYLRDARFTASPEPLETLHERVPLEHQTPREDSPFNDTFAFVNRVPGLFACYERLIQHAARHTFCGVDLVFEHAPMLRFHYPVPLPRKYRVRDGLHLTHHSDVLLGDPFEQLNIWIPLTLCSGTATLQVVPLESSIELLGSFAAQCKHDWETFRNGRDGFFEFLRSRPRYVETLANASTPVEVGYGEMLVFDPRLIHATAENVENVTRVSMDFRVLAASDYDRLQAGLKELGMTSGSFGEKAYERGAYYDARTSAQLERELGAPPDMARGSGLRY
jgi:hypothetical protein